ncbi:hypothetical protein KVR01_011211 [Diaporthe batatas]|uniref:uncharacterized protein n=1 Tax=Diaporthe batatas TaxID=748121 RepID=UPI001D052DF0|nr:uncharacterized protein KVR01_011211 [Diaporthe batatas]KAG8158768.1 hypothetical protein KVR01_011211 [Diaporthe batatas]
MSSRWDVLVHRLPLTTSLTKRFPRSLPEGHHFQSSEHHTLQPLRASSRATQSRRQLASHSPPSLSVISHTANVIRPAMGKKKDKKRAREAAAAAAAAANGAAQGSTAKGVVSQQQRQQTMAPIPDSTPQGHNPFSAESSSGPPPFIPPWSAVNMMTMAANGLNGGAGYPMPQMMNGLQNFSMPFLQPNMFTSQQFPNMFGMGMGSMAFSTMPPNMFPGQPPSPAQGQYDAAHPPDTNGRSGRAASPSSNKNGRAAITPPSKASGGIPDPTPLYLARASFLPKRRAEPGPLLVVIDLNGTILYRPDRRKSQNFRRRPHADAFVRYCVETFWVVFWSSARPENVRRMVEGLVGPDLLPNVVAVWGRDRFGLTPEDYSARTQCYKRLTTLWADPVVRASFPADRPGYEGRCWDQGNTVLIDDSVEKARSEPHNAITIPEFTGDMNESLDILPRVHDYLNELCFQEDVSTYGRAHPFKMA